MLDRADRRAGIFDHMPDAAGDADFRDDGEDHVLGAHAGAEHAVHGDAHGLRLDLPQRLRRQHVVHFRRPDPESERAERPVGRGMTVAAHHDQAGLA